MIKFLKTISKFTAIVLTNLILFIKKAYLLILIILIASLSFVFFEDIAAIVTKKNAPAITANTEEYDSKFKNIKALEISSIAMRIIEQVSKYDKLDYHSINLLESKLKTFGMIEISSSCQSLNPALIDFNELKSIIDDISRKQIKNLCFKKEKPSFIKNFISKNIRIETKNTVEKCTMDTNTLMHKLLRGEYDDAIIIIDAYKNYKIDNVYISNLDTLYDDTVLRKNFKTCIKLIIE